MNTTVIETQNVCEEFHATPTKDMAEDIITFIFNIDSQLESGADVCPRKVLSNADTQILVDTLMHTDGLAAELLDFILTLTSDFESVCFTRKFCVSFQSIRARKIHFMDKVSACSADDYRIKSER
ncbi:hypothetical protein EDD85DRAFT_1029704 [Armillaria nabsnona]|nr:hypothetical protein EDD85DRAFT_1029704 [Armillaria nabsnona]